MAALQLEKRRPTAATSEEWPVGMRVMAVDDDRVCLKILEVTLQMYKYNVTTATNAKEALQMLREKKGWYELVITDLHMPEMDGIELLQQIKLEMDLPCYLQMTNADRETVMKGVRYGACEYTVKPWQHDEQGAKSTRKNSRNKKNDEHHSLESKENDSTKKPRVSWSVELHGQFVDAVNRIGIDKAGPKKISDMMNVDHVSRGSVASHLQKYKRRLSKDPKSKPDNNDGLCHEAEIRKMSNMELSEHSHEDRICLHPSSVVASSSSNNHFASQQPIQPLGMGTVSPGGIMPNYPSASASAGAGATGYGSYPKTLSDMLLEANQRTASSHLGNPSARIPSSGQLFRPLNQFPVQPAAPVNHSSALNMMNAPATNLAAPLGVGDTSMFPGLAGNYNNTWQTLVPSQFPDLLRGDGTYAGPSQANVTNINQLASSGQIPMIQNEMQNLMAASNSNTSSSVVVSIRSNSNRFISGSYLVLVGLGVVQGNQRVGLLVVFS
ncbi:hypothetical protein BRADI_1g30805v3 [Brachypodium distachyon]|uniref:Response regulatory domain-containing protein n=1 Tax=Brachypodium distachyon TaxID=15368 RepID=A0A0Q3H1J2_BRADI|nr:hypothetical protein BRADI_1g30805v3 [Brachypodium distachyon]